MKFSKMHGLGNDFVIVDAITQNIHLSSKIIHQLSNRYLGIGFDQLLIVERPYKSNFDFHYRIFNADGSEAEQCGNGARCFALFVYMKKLTNKRNLHVSTNNGKLMLSIMSDNLIKVDMGEPNFDPKHIPFIIDKKELTYVLCVEKQTISCGVVSLGNPHCILTVNDIHNIQIQTLGPAIETHELFPKKVNVGFMQIINKNHIKLRVHERGAGETKACGSGACAAVAVGINQGQLNSAVQVDLPGGILLIDWSGTGYPIYMTGSAHHVYDGSIDL